MNRVLASRSGVPYVLTYDGYVVPLTNQMQGTLTALLIEDPSLADSIEMQLVIGVSAILKPNEICEASTVGQFITELNPLLLLNEFTTPAYVLANAAREAQNILRQMGEGEQGAVQVGTSTQVHVGEAPTHRTQVGQRGPGQALSATP